MQDAWKDYIEMEVDAIGPLFLAVEILQKISERYLDREIKKVERVQKIAEKREEKRQ